MFVGDGRLKHKMTIHFLTSNSQITADIAGLPDIAFSVK